ncbi:DUF1800 domain-containing protein [Luteolibacter yonseiensis]|uniref:DUF1800 domain-containing protein n=1 Tax=Luteolibacter yonseiensis TaxID=1144680 RepID=A0A934V6H8_9BACT|nr:DUF1800 domain-containing protein [Luteolibacter yonseiensis]MBK1815047.1 DUF1800 domain-containing protein [Luteolibacter yonseiensis]
MLPKADQTWTIFEAAHLLNRAGFGGSPSDIRNFHGLGREKAVESLVSPAEPLDAFPLPEWSSDEQVAEDYKKLIAGRQALRQQSRGLSPEKAEMAKREAQRAVRREYREREAEARTWWFRRMLTTEAPLREKMTLFWHDHFATSVQKVKQTALVVRQNDLFRRHAFGSFRDLTQAILMDPAMTLYLDTQSSKKGMPNENFAREVMELFTLGEGNYSEQDIREAARAFTGYQINRATGTVTHNKKQWDGSNKTIFGKTAPYDGKGVIDLIFTKKETARFMAGKLWEFFVYEKPNAAALDALAEVFQQADFRTGPLLREIFLSREFYAASSIRSQIKCPVQYSVGLLKQLEISTPPAGFPITSGEQLGQVLFMPPNVAGWDWGQAWINTNTLLTRYNLAGYLTKGAGETEKVMASEKVRMPGMKDTPKRAARGWDGPDYEKIAPRPLRENPENLVDSLIFRFFQGPLPEKARGPLVEYAIAKKGAIFTNKETAELCHLMLSTPYYQLY